MMNSLTKRLAADLRSLNVQLHCKESWSSVAFYGKVGIRRKLRPKNAKFGSFIDFDHDFVTAPNDDSEARHRFLFASLEHLEAIRDEAECGRIVFELQIFFLHDGNLHAKHVCRILAAVESHYRSPKVASLIDITLPDTAVINICGDIHGQYYDLMKILKLRGPPSKANFYLFNGDIVDKGARSLECILLLFVCKILYPEFVFLNRGNHESSIVNAKHGFQKELAGKYGVSSMDHFMFEFFGEVFRWMPIAHVINSKILVVHGGISDSASLTLDDIRNVRRPVEPQENEIAAGALWSDPVIKPGVQPSSRGIGVFFGPDVTKRFLDTNDLTCMVRSHTEIQAGCGLSHAGCYTVFSAPNKNRDILGGVMVVDAEKNLEVQGNVFTECHFDEATGLLHPSSSEEATRRLDETEEVEA